MKARTLIFLMIPALLVCVPAQARDAWLAAGIGGGSKGVAAMISGSVQLGTHSLISVRSARTQELSRVNDDDGFFSGGYSFYPSASDWGVLVGLFSSKRLPTTTLSISAGIGQATITEAGEWVDNWFFSDFYEKKEARATGWLFQAQLFGEKFGAEVFADFNSVGSFGGLVVSWRFGRIGG